MQVQIHLLDPISLTIRSIIVVAGVIIGILLLVRRKRHLSLGIIQIVFSICAPLLMSIYCYVSKKYGLAIESDLEFFANQLRFVQYGALMPLLLLVPYVVLIITSALSIKAIVDDSTKSKKKIRH